VTDTLYKKCKFFVKKITLNIISDISLYSGHFNAILASRPELRYTVCQHYPNSGQSYLILATIMNLLLNLYV